MTAPDWFSEFLVSAQRARDEEELWDLARFPALRGALTAEVRRALPDADDLWRRDEAGKTLTAVAYGAILALDATMNSAIFRVARHPSRSPEATWHRLVRTATKDAKGMLRLLLDQAKRRSRARKSVYAKLPQKDTEILERLRYLIIAGVSVSKKTGSVLMRALARPEGDKETRDEDVAADAGALGISEDAYRHRRERGLAQVKTIPLALIRAILRELGAY